MEIPIPFGFGRVVIGKNLVEPAAPPPTDQERIAKIDQGILKSELAETQLRSQRKQSETRASAHTKKAVDAHSSGNRTEEAVNVAHIAAARKEGEVVGQFEIQAAQLSSVYRLARGMIRSQSSMNESIGLLGNLNLDPEVTESLGAINQASSRILEITDTISNSMSSTGLFTDDIEISIREEIAAEANARAAQPRGSSVEASSTEENLPA